MKDEVVSKEAFSKPQLAVQSYLDELLQEATLDIQDIDSFDADNTALPEVETPDIVEELAPVEVELLPNEPSKEAQASIEEPILDQENSKVKEEQEDNHPIEQNEVLASSEASIQENEDTKVELEKKPIVETPAVAAPSPSPVITKEERTDLANYEIEPQLEKAKDLPWAESRFECLLFNVGGLKIAVPLVELGSIQKANFDTITSIFGQPDWFIGISTVNDLRVRAVDTAKWVMPNHYKGELKQTFNFIIQLDRSDWGLACEEVAEAITLEPSEVKWRTDRTKRPWLAGTVIKHMCAILDVQGFINLLDDPNNGFKATLK